MPERANVIEDPILSDKVNKAKAKKEAEKARKEAEKYRLKGDQEAYRRELEHAKKMHEEELKWQQQLMDDKEVAEFKLHEEIAKKNQESYRNLANTVGSNLKSYISSSLSSGIGDLESRLESVMNSWIEKQESIAYNLNGSTTTASKISDNLTKAINGTGIVKQQEVYENIASLVESGIIYNVEQRAYLATLAEDLGMAFDTTNKSLNRLIRLQSNDLSDNIMAIEANLKTFLNQNYQTSEYIQDGFYNVSDALLEAQSLMSSSGAMALEEVIQQWMGSLYSVGMSANTVTSIAEAIGNLGSGNINALANSNIGKLLNMAASVSGLSYSDILNNGLTQDNANKLMSGIVNYLADINDNSSNVVKSSLAEVFGVSVSDIVAAASLNSAGNPTVNGIISDGIGTLLGKTDKYIYLTQQIENAIENFTYAWGTSVASDSTEYAVYRIADIASDILGATLDGVTISAAPFGAGFTVDVGKVLSHLGLVATIGGLSDSIGSAFANLTSKSTDSAALKIYKSLAGGGDNIKIAGDIFGDLNTGISSSAVMSSKYGVNLDSDAAAAAAVTSATTTTDTVAADELDESEQWQSDIKNSLESLLDEVKLIPSNPFNTYTRITEAENTVTIGNDMSTVYNIIADSAASLRNIYTLLSNYFTGYTGSSVTAEDILALGNGGLMNNGYNIEVIK